jgi:hypothetical protein
MPALAPFSPGGTVTLVSGGASTNVALPATAGDNLMITSPAGGAVAFFKTGNSTVVASVASDTPILPDTAQMFTIPPDHTHVAAIGVATLYFTVGDGQ